MRDDSHARAINKKKHKAKRRKRYVGEYPINGKPKSNRCEKFTAKMMRNERERALEELAEKKRMQEYAEMEGLSYEKLLEVRANYIDSANEGL